MAREINPAFIIQNKILNSYCGHVLQWMLCQEGIRFWSFVWSWKCSKSFLQSPKSRFQQLKLCWWFLGVEITFWDGRVRSVNSEVAPRGGSLFMNSVEFLSRHLAPSWWPRPSGAPTTIISPLESTPNRTLRSSKSLRAAFGLLWHLYHQLTPGYFGQRLGKNFRLKSIYSSTNNSHVSEVWRDELSAT